MCLRCTHFGVQSYTDSGILIDGGQDMQQWSRMSIRECKNVYCLATLRPCDAIAPYVVPVFAVKMLIWTEYCPVCYKAARQYKHTE